MTGFARGSTLCPRSRALRGQGFVTPGHPHSARAVSYVTWRLADRRPAGPPPWTPFAAARTPLFPRPPSQGWVAPPTARLSRHTAGIFRKRLRGNQAELPQALSYLLATRVRRRSPLQSPSPRPRLWLQECPRHAAAHAPAPPASLGDCPAGLGAGQVRRGGRPVQRRLAPWVGSRRLREPAPEVRGALRTRREPRRRPSYLKAGLAGHTGGSRKVTDGCETTPPPGPRCQRGLWARRRDGLAAPLSLSGSHSPQSSRTPLPCSLWARPGAPRNRAPSPTNWA